MDLENVPVNPTPKKKKKWAIPSITTSDLYKIAQQSNILQQLETIKESPIKKIVPLQPLTQEEWDKMEGKARWDSIVGLRGPDLTNSYNVKWFSNSVIRFRLSKVMRVGGLISECPFVVLPRGISYDDDTKFQFSWNHYVTHIQEACYWLHIPICWLEWVKWKAIFLSPSGTHSIMKALAGVVNEPYRSYFLDQTGGSLATAESSGGCDSGNLPIAGESSLTTPFESE